MTDEIKVKPDTGSIRVLQKQKYIYMRGLDGWLSWFKPHRYTANISYSIQVKNEAGDWEDVPVVIEMEQEA